MASARRSCLKDCVSYRLEIVLDLREPIAKIDSGEPVVTHVADWVHKKQKKLAKITERKSHDEGREDSMDDG